jgi:ribosomal protein L11 methyltransferase
LAPQTLTPPLIEQVADRAWERVWLEDFAPTRFGRRLWVCPRGQAPDPAQTSPDTVIVELDPGLAFGTGHHATTALCLEPLDGADLAGKTVLDYGRIGHPGDARCGSAEHAVAVDHDPQALEATRDNALQNAVTGRFAILAPDDLPLMRAHVLLPTSCRARWLS